MNKKVENALTIAFAVVFAISFLGTCAGVFHI